MLQEPITDFLQSYYSNDEDFSATVSENIITTVYILNLKDESLRCSLMFQVLMTSHRYDLEIKNTKACRAALLLSTINFPSIVYLTP